MFLYSEASSCQPKTEVFNQKARQAELHAPACLLDYYPDMFALNLTWCTHLQTWVILTPNIWNNLTQNLVDYEYLLNISFFLIGQNRIGRRRPLWPLVICRWASVCLCVCVCVRQECEPHVSSVCVFTLSRLLWSMQQNPSALAIHPPSLSACLPLCQLLFLSASPSPPTTPET